MGAKCTWSGRGAQLTCIGRVSWISKQSYTKIENKLSSEKQTPNQQQMIAVRAGNGDHRRSGLHLWCARLSAAKARRPQATASGEDTAHRDKRWPKELRTLCEDRDTGDVVKSESEIGMGGPSRALHNFNFQICSGKLWVRKDAREDSDVNLKATSTEGRRAVWRQVRWESGKTTYKGEWRAQRSRLVAPCPPKKYTISNRCPTP